MKSLKIRVYCLNSLLFYFCFKTQIGVDDVSLRPSSGICVTTPTEASSIIQETTTTTTRAPQPSITELDW